MVITWRVCPLRTTPSSSASSDDMQTEEGFDKDKEREVGCSKKDTKEKHTESGCYEESQREAAFFKAISFLS